MTTFAVGQRVAMLPDRRQSWQPEEAREITAIEDVPKEMQGDVLHHQWLAFGDSISNRASGYWFDPDVEPQAVHVHHAAETVAAVLKGKGDRDDHGAG